MTVESGHAAHAHRPTIDPVIVERAPGKLFIAGEYAVVEPGEPAVLVAVDRFVTVELTESEDSGSIISPQYGRLPVVWTRHDDRVVVERDHRPYDFVLSTISVVEQLVAERSLAPRFYDITISSELDDVSGRKFGLGSSAAVTVATVRALDRFYALELSPLQMYKLALIASVRVSPSLSGGDIAASTFGGWIAYRAPDRADVLETYRAEGVSALLERDWSSLDVRPLTPPRDLRLVVGWTGQPASTERLVGNMQHSKWAGQSHYRDFVADSRSCVDAVVAGLDAGDGSAVLTAITRARRLLGALASNAGLTIETPALSALCDSAEAVGAAGKSSGAGGGDCGIVLAPADADVARMLRAWEQNDIRHLDVSVCAPTVTQSAAAAPIATQSTATESACTVAGERR